jgi:hypothetical protein
MNTNITVVGIEVMNNYETSYKTNDGEKTRKGAVMITLQLAGKKIDLFELLNKDGLVERNDSCILLDRLNHLAEFLKNSELDLDNLFAGPPQVYGLAQVRYPQWGVPSEIYDIIDEAIKNGPHSVMWARPTVAGFSWQQKRSA